MVLAFHNDPSAKADLLNLLDLHIAGGSLKIGATSWDGAAGSPLGVSVQGTDPHIYAERFGYPFALASLLDPMSNLLGTDEIGISFVRAWVERVEPGSDLDPVPVRIVRQFLMSSGASDSFPQLVNRVIELQERELGDDKALRKEWSDLQRDVSDAREANSHFPKQFHAQICEAACWPVSSSQSVLSEVARLWIMFADSRPVPGWDKEVAKTLHFLLGDLFSEARELSKSGPKVTGEELLHQRHPDLAAKGDMMLASKAQIEREHLEHSAEIVLSALAEVH